MDCRNKRALVPRRECLCCDEKAQNREGPCPRARRALQRQLQPSHSDVPRGRGAWGAAGPAAGPQQRGGIPGSPVPLAHLTSPSCRGPGCCLWKP